MSSNQPSRLEHLTLKFLMIGDANVGKTSLVRRLILDQFADSIESTVGIEFMIFKMKINDTKVILQIWDTAGQESYRALGRAYYRDAIGVMLVFSYNNHESFESLGQWISDAHNLCHPQAKIMLVGNKSDLIDERRVSKTEIEEFSQSNRIEFIETSAKLNTNVAEAFYRCARSILQGIAANEIRLNTNVPQLDKKSNENDDSCSC